MTRHKIVCAALLPSLLTLAACLAPANPPGPAPDAPGPVLLEIRTAELALRDAARDKELGLHLSWPEGEGPWPLIVFSHGAFSSGRFNKPLAHHWATRGYVVIQPTHSDSLELRPPGERARALRDVRDVRDGMFGDWMSRPRDVSFVLDSLDAIEKRLPALAGKIDRERIGAGGHSFGAHTAQLLGGAKPATPGGRPIDLRDPRVRCVLLISPQGRGGLLHEVSWETLAAPMMTITGSRDFGAGGQNAAWRTEPFEFAPEDGSKALVWIDGADHGFGGITGREGRGRHPNPKHLAIVQEASQLFWDAWLKDRREGYEERLKALGDGVAVTVK